jgi:Rnl2 family RNA ligase
MMEEGHTDSEFIVEEKIHGANFSIWSDEVKTLPAKRSGFVQGDDNFFNCHQVVKQYYSQIRAMFTKLQQERDASVVTLCGELYGGLYPHKDVPHVQNATKVQKGVYYCPQNDFYGFDIMVDGQYLSVDETNALYDEFGIPRADTLFRGSLEECLKYPNEFQSKLAEKFGLPPIDNNICEGVVIKPVEPKFLFDGSRVILKNKNEKFTEVQKESKPKTVIPELSLEAQKALEVMSSYVTENRLKNVLSKLGSISKQDFGKVMGAMNQDITEDFLKDHEGLLNVLEKPERKRVTKQVYGQAAQLIRGNFLNIVDGEF